MTGRILMNKLLLVTNDRELAGVLRRLDNPAPADPAAAKGDAADPDTMDRAGWQIERVDTLEAAQQRLQAEPFDAVLLDVATDVAATDPALDDLEDPAGADQAKSPPDELFEFGRLLQQAEQRAAPPLMVLVAPGDLQSRRRAWQSGAADVVCRPIVLEELRARLARLPAAGKLGEGGAPSRGRRAEKPSPGKSRSLQFWPMLKLLWRLAAAAEDPDTFPVQHVARVGLASRELALLLGHEAAWADMLLWAAPLHDVGNLWVSREILQKPEPLDPEEWAVLEEHCRLGARLLQDDAAIWQALAELPGYLRPKQDVVKLSEQLLRAAATVALSHHERWDGTGYPQGLREEEIPLEGRIVAVADVFDSLTSPRPYRGAYDERTALEIMENTAGKLLDPEVYGAFLKALPRIRAIRRALADQNWQAAVACGESE